jgi:hypothetical protein
MVKDMIADHFHHRRYRPASEVTSHPFSHMAAAALAGRPKARSPTLPFVLLVIRPLSLCHASAAALVLYMHSSHRLHVEQSPSVPFCQIECAFISIPAQALCSRPSATRAATYIRVDVITERAATHAHAIITPAATHVQIGG